MIADGIKAIFDICRASTEAGSRVHTIEEPNGDKRIYSTDGAGGVSAELVARPEDRHVHRLASIVEIPNYLGDHSCASVWVSPWKVEVLIDHGATWFRDNRLYVLYEKDPVFLFLQRERQLSQTEFSRLIQTVLWNALDEPASLLKSVNALTYHHTESGTAKLEKSRATVDRSIDAAIQSTVGELPETLEIATHVVVDHRLPFVARRIPCRLLTEAGKPVFELIPIADGLEAAERSLADDVQAYLAEALSCPVYQGFADL